MSSIEKLSDNHDGTAEVNSFAEAMQDVEPFKAPESIQGEAGEKDQNLEKARRIFIEKYAAKVLERNIPDFRERSSISEQEIECLISGGNDNPDDVVFHRTNDAVDSYKVALLCLAGSEDALRKVDEMDLKELERDIFKTDNYQSGYYQIHYLAGRFGDQKSKELLRQGSKIIKAAIPEVFKKRVEDPRRSLEDKFESIEKTFK